MARLEGYIKQADAAAEKASTDRVTVQYFPNQDQPGQGLPEEVRITTRKRDGADRSNRVDVALDKMFGLKVRVDEQGHKSYPIKAPRGGERGATRGPARLGPHCPRRAAQPPFHVGI
ncbi:MAG: hypothetical protein WKG07_34210 [Hymenobacter sp.]